MSDPVKHNQKLWERATAEGQYFLIWCPACKCGHGIPTPRWGFNGSTDKPTFTPSVKLTTPGHGDYCCHFNVTEGKIQYHGDCNHDMKGQLIDMAEIPENYGF